MGEKRGAYRVLVGKSERMGSFGRPRHRWEDNTKMDVHEVGWGVRTALIWHRVGSGSRHF